MCNRICKKEMDFFFHRKWTFGMSSMQLYLLTEILFRWMHTALYSVKASKLALYMCITAHLLCLHWFELSATVKLTKDGIWFKIIDFIYCFAMVKVLSFKLFGAYFDFTSNGIRITQLISLIVCCVNGISLSKKLVDMEC